MPRWWWSLLAKLHLLPCDFGRAGGNPCRRPARWRSGGLQTRLPDGWQRQLRWCRVHRGADDTPLYPDP